MIFSKNYKVINKILIIFVLISFFFNSDNFFDLNYFSYESNKKYRKVLEDKIFYSNKWIVMTALKPPSPFIINLTKEIGEWKIVVVGINETNDIKWNIFNSSNRLVYLSTEIQKHLNYLILRYLKPNTYYRKCLGYLYSIQHGAKEIFEMEEDLVFYDKSFLNNYFDNIYVSFVQREDSLMTNPYPHFGYSDIWPRGFKIDDIGKQSRNQFHFVNSRNIYLKPLIFQGLINNFPDIDSIFYLTRIKNKSSFNFQSSNSYPLLYFPNNYIPVNSKNTRFLYNIFPLLIFPISLDENTADIWRGYIMQYFVWKIGGIIIYYSSDCYRAFEQKKLNLIKDKKNYFVLNKLLELLNSFPDKNYNIDLIELNNEFLNMLCGMKILGKSDIRLYKAFIKDLNNIGYNFSFFSINKTKAKSNALNYVKINSDFYLYIPSSLFIIKNEKLKLMNHFSQNKVFKDILLIINYNKKGFLQLNHYIENLYNKYFPNIIFIYPSEINGHNIISCKESYNGSYSYICFKKIYNKYPNYKGYLYINDDLFLKVWEISNFNFSIPWISRVHPIYKTWYHYSQCYSLYKIFDQNNEWKNNLIKFNGLFEVLSGMSDFYYLPNYYASKIIDIFVKFYKSKIFLECAIPNSFGILLAVKYQILIIGALWEDQRKKIINYLYSKSNQVAIHPIKLSSEISRKKLLQYIFFVNSNEY